MTKPRRPKKATPRPSPAPFPPAVGTCWRIVSAGGLYWLPKLKTWTAEVRMPTRFDSEEEAGRELYRLLKENALWASGAVVREFFA